MPARLVGRSLPAGFDGHTWARSWDRRRLPRGNYLNADWTSFRTIVSTSTDQIAIGPGRLEREWTDGARHYFQYETESPVIDLVVFTSARYEVREDRWNDVAIEIFYDRDHAYNIDRMIEMTQKSLDYFSAQFGPYPHRHLRIVEVPNYIGHTAMSLAGTIAFSESWGFISRVGAADVDIVTNVIAHEIAHQWWNHQVVPAATQGATFIAEALSEYSALILMEHELGAEAVRRTLRWELDTYLRGRSRETIAEVPLLLVENQPYIHYGKGSLILYALRDYVGEEAINAALRRFLEAKAFGGPPYATSLELLDQLREAIPPSHQYLIADMFETITLFDNRIEEATFQALEDGTFLVRVVATARKLRADGQGIETAVAIGDWIDIGVFGRGSDDDGGTESVLFLEKRQVTETRQVFEVVVSERPARAGIDPYHMLIERDVSDNVKNVLETR